MDFLSLLNQYVNMYAVLIAVGLMQGIKAILPTPRGGSTFDVNPIINRILPFVPLIISGIATILIDGYSANNVAKGLVSGFTAVYLYRTTKVTIFGD